jgi:hypothetical protein
MSVMSDTPLNRAQQRIVEEIAREEGRPCSHCGSMEWEAPSRVTLSTVDWYGRLTCARCGNGSRRLRLSREEAASRLDLHPGGRRRRFDETGGSRAPRA